MHHNIANYQSQSSLPTWLVELIGTDILSVLGCFPHSSPGGGFLGGLKFWNGTDDAVQSSEVGYR